MALSAGSSPARNLQWQRCGAIKRVRRTACLHFARTGSIFKARTLAPLTAPFIPPFFTRTFSAPGACRGCRLPGLFWPDIHPRHAAGRERSGPGGPACTHCPACAPGPCAAAGSARWRWHAQRQRAPPLLCGHTLPALPRRATPPSAAPSPLCQRPAATLRPPASPGGAALTAQHLTPALRWRLWGRCSCWGQRGGQQRWQ